MGAPSPAHLVTVRDIAKRLKVSHTTVSRALKNDPRISGPVRQKVQATAREMGYRPDPMLGALARYRADRSSRGIRAELAWVNCWPEPERLRHYGEFDLYWQGARVEAERAGYRLEEFRCPGELTPERLEQIFRARNIRGLLLTPAWSTDQPDWGGFHRELFSVVRFGYSLASPPAHVVTSDQVLDGLLAYESMWSRGYRRIGMVMWTTQGTRAVRFSAGYLYGQLRMGARPKLLPLSLSENRQESGSRLKAWLKQTRPDAILTDIAELPAMLTQAGYAVPQDVGLAALSVLDGHADAGINQNSEEIGRAAVQTLISLVNHYERGVPQIPREVLVAGRWVDGASLPRRNPTRAGLKR